MTMKSGKKRTSANPFGAQKARLKTAGCATRRGWLVGGGRARADAEDVGNWPCGGIRVILPKSGFITATHFQFHGSRMQIELSFRPALEMLGGDKADVGRQQFVVEIVHREWRAGKNK